MSAAPVAAVDLGTHTALLLVCRGRPAGELEVLHDELAFARLGEGLARTGRLDPESIERTLGVLAGFRDRAGAFGAGGRLRIVGTAVLRRAHDAADFVERCRDELGLAIEVISGEEEARLGHLAVASPGHDTVIIDAGGASTEVVGDEGAERVSAPIGALILTERYLGFGGEPPLEPGGWPALCAEITDRAVAFPAGAGAAADVVLLGGSGTNLACLEASRAGLSAFDHARVEGTRVPVGAARAWADHLVTLGLSERRALPIEPERAELLPAGLACIAAALDRLDAKEARVTGRGLRYGVARELLAALNG